jgi:hypothetical protein
MALMRKGRMTVKTTTKPVSKPSSDRFTTGKSGVKNTPEVTVTGQRKWESPPKDLEGQWKYYGKDPRHEYEPGLGKKTKHKKLSPEELDRFNAEERKRGMQLIAKEVRWDPTDKAKEWQGAMPGRFQSDYYDPIKDKAVYDAAAKKRKDEYIAAEKAKYTKTTPPAKPTPAPPAKTTGLPAGTQEYSKPGPRKPVEMVYKAIQAPGGKTRQVKNTPRVGGPIQKNKITKTKLNIKGQIEGAKFRREEKLAGAYTRTKEAIQKKGDDASWNMGLSPKNKTKQAMLKDFKGELKTTKKSATDKGTKKAAGSAIKDVRKSQRFEKKEMAGKTKYFTKSKMAEQVEKKPSMKGRMQAGKMRYS